MVFIAGLFCFSFVTNPIWHTHILTVRWPYGSVGGVTLPDMQVSLKILCCISCHLMSAMQFIVEVINSGIPQPPGAVCFLLSG